MFNNATPENNNDPEKNSSKYYGIDEMHNIVIPNRNKSLPLFPINGCSPNDNIDYFNIF